MLKAAAGCPVGKMREEPWEGGGGGGGGADDAGDAETKERRRG